LLGKLQRRLESPLRGDWISALKSQTTYANMTFCQEDIAASAAQRPYRPFGAPSGPCLIPLTLFHFRKG
jgi:hypothetical protein